MFSIKLGRMLLHLIPVSQNFRGLLLLMPPNRRLLLYDLVQTRQNKTKKSQT